MSKSPPSPPSDIGSPYARSDILLSDTVSVIRTDCTELANTMSVFSAYCDDLKRQLKEKHSEVIVKDNMIMEKKNKLSQLQADILAILPS